MTLDDSTRRQLRFSLFLQLAGFVMFLVAFAVRFRSVGFDAVTAVFAVALVLILVAVVATRRQLRR